MSGSITEPLAKFSTSAKKVLDFSKVHEESMRMESRRSRAPLRLIASKP
ncbi:MAG: hypothetical protein ACOC3I_10320 [Verrucomicrobiota bacterium]